jgi:putative nucleotidyltransferase with HDIG domain
MPTQHDVHFKKVTIVDDEPWALDVLVRAARSWEYQCQAAVSAEEALALLERQPTPTVVTDIRMPGRGGVWLVREIHRRWPDAGVIVITASNDREAVLDCLEAGADHYFLKPINLDEFYHALERSTRNCRLQRENTLYRKHLETTVRHKTGLIRQTFLSAIDSLVRTLEARDPYTTGHSLRVRRLAVKLARQLGLEQKRVRQVSLAAKLHDIGKVGVPEATLHKIGELTAEEVSQIREHPVIGERILTPMLRNRMVLGAIRGHHERFDGTGYPDGLRGQQIPLLARIITVADCFDAMTSSRAYRGALSVDEALCTLRAAAGSQFDPELVTAFLAAPPSRDRTSLSPCVRNTKSTFPNYPNISED